MQDLLPSEFIEFAIHLARQSAEIIRPYFRQPYSVEHKADGSPVTIADQKAEELMRKEIIRSYPEHGIIGEEFGKYNETAEFQWILDPIDGTKSFICGALSFGTLIALTKKGKPVLGVFNQPVLNDLMIGDNQSTTLNGEQARVRECNDLKQAVLLTTDHLHIAEFQNPDGFNTLLGKVNLYRNWGDCYGYYLLCTGFADIMIDPVMNLWDMAALLPILKGAGAAFSSYTGGDPLDDESLVAANPKLLNKVIRQLNNK